MISPQDGGLHYTVVVVVVVEHSNRSVVLFCALSSSFNLN